MSLSEAETRLAVLAGRLARANARRKEAEEEVTNLKSEVAEILGGTIPEGFKLNTGDGVTVACGRIVGRRFSEEKAATMLPPGVLAMISTMRPDQKIAKAKLDPKVYSELMSPGSISLVVK